MNTNIRGRIAAVAFAGTVALFGLTACGGTEAPTEKPSSSQSQEESTDLRGNDLQVYTNEANQIAWRVYAPGGTAEGTVDIEVGDQTFADQKTSGKVYPDLAPGDYTVHVTYTNKDGEVLENNDEQFTFSTEKVELKFADEDPKIVAGKPYSLNMEVVGGTPTAGGTVTVTDMDTDEEITTATVKDGKFTLDMPAPEVGSIPLTIKYSGDGSNDGVTIDRELTAEEG